MDNKENIDLSAPSGDRGIPLSTWRGAGGAVLKPLTALLLTKTFSFLWAQTIF